MRHIEKVLISKWRNNVYKILNKILPIIPWLCILIWRSLYQLRYILICNITQPTCTLANSQMFDEVVELLDPDMKPTGSELEVNQT